MKWLADHWVSVAVVLTILILLLLFRGRIATAIWALGAELQGVFRGARANIIAWRYGYQPPGTPAVPGRQWWRPRLPKLPVMGVLLVLLAFLITWGIRSLVGGFSKTAIPPPPRARMIQVPATTGRARMIQPAGSTGRARMIVTPTPHARMIRPP